MTTQTDALASRRHTPLPAVGWHRPLMLLTAAMLVLVLVCAVGLVVDDRTITGMPAWTKPLKFSLSIAIYSATLAWLLDQLPGRGRRTGRLTWWLGTVIALCLAIEQVVIVAAVLRGTTSHFNNTSPLNAALFSLMAVSIVVVWLATMVIGVVLVRGRIGDEARRLALAAGVAIGLVGMAVAFLMTAPTPAQLEAATGIYGAHTVGLADGGPGLPFVGWSTVGGDLRIPHFVGLHALQVLPLTALGAELLAGRVPWLRRVRRRTALVAAATTAVGGTLAVTLWQALRGQSVVAPDAATVLGAVAVVGLTVVAAALGLARDRRAAS